ncbi:unnamed protein product [Phytophthora lilii]|uniref:Unnamed protein product n=1 Tax=Phytophthora lilii TaxID=2077276 RepID=A0A9W6YIN6_9STRA|nr:unnamed protein product [Phytophthora lilii]
MSDAVTLASTSAIAATETPKRAPNATKWRDTGSSGSTLAMFGKMRPRRILTNVHKARLALSSAAVVPATASSCPWQSKRCTVNPNAVNVIYSNANSGNVSGLPSSTLNAPKSPPIATWKHLYERLLPV